MQAILKIDIRPTNSLCKKDLYELGKTEIKSPQGNLIPVYDIERTICDIIIDR